MAPVAQLSRCIGQACTPCVARRTPVRRSALYDKRQCVCAARKTSQVTVSLRPTPVDPPANASMTPCWVAGFSIVMFVAVIARVFHPKKATEKKPVETFEVVPLAKRDPEAYQRALARSRQSSCIQKSVAFMKSGSAARAMVELGKALQENGIARSQYVCSHTTAADLAGLYRLHLQNTEIPPNFAVLLQLREMLGIPKSEADNIESEILRTPSAFSI